jgi:hypothetical protein
MVGDRQVSDRRTVLQAIGAVAGLGATGVVSADRDRSRVRSGSDGPLGSVSIDGAAEAVPGENGEWAYVADYQGFAAVDISDPTDPTVAATRSLPGVEEVLDVDIDEGNDRLAAAGPANGGGGLGIEHPDDPEPPEGGSGFGLYDISDPSNPENLAIFETNYAIHNCYYEDGIVYLVNNSTAEMVLVDVSDDDPTEVSRWSLSGATILHDLFVQDGVAYLPCWNSGTPMVDVSDPSDPSLIGLAREGSSKSPNNDHYVMPSEDGTVLAIGKEQIGPFGNLGVELWDISDKTDTEFLAELDPPAQPEFGERTSHNFDLSGDHLYTSWYAGGVEVHDISTPSSPTEVASFRGDGPEFWTAKVAEDGEFYVASDYGEGGLYTFSDPKGSSPPDPDPGLDVSTGGATDVGENSAALTGTLADLGEADSAEVWFEWGPLGSDTPNQTDPETLSATGSFSADLSGLEADTTYEFVAYAETGSDSDTGNRTSFETDGGFEFCFITTATADETETLDSLRRFRDESMLATPVGTGLVGLYYRVSPPIARTLHRHPDSTEAELTRSVVDICASLSETQNGTDSRVRSAALGVLLTMLYVVGLLVGAGSHLSLRARETVGR